MGQLGCEPVVLIWDASTSGSLCYYVTVLALVLTLKVERLQVQAGI